jgi:Rieske Fe-S protein
MSPKLGGTREYKAIRARNPDLFSTSQPKPLSNIGIQSDPEEDQEEDIVEYVEKKNPKFIINQKRLP